MLPIVVQFFSKFGVKHGILEFIEQQHEIADALFNNIKYAIEANGLNLNQLVSIRATGLACCLPGAWWPVRPGHLSRLNFENLAWPDQANKYIRPGYNFLIDFFA